MPKNQGGRRPGQILYAEAFEALLAARNILKKDIAEEIGVSPSFIADLLACRGGASDEVAARIASALNVKVAAIFPEIAGWTSPIPDRDAKRRAA